MLQRTYPGQLPQIRRDCFQLVIPVYFTDAEDVLLVADTLLNFVKRKIAIRIGLVPITKTKESLEQARVVYHLANTYGLQAALVYLETSYTSKMVTGPSKSAFDTAVKSRHVRQEKVAVP